MRSHLVVRDFIAFQEPDEVLAGHSQVVRGRLRREGLFLRDQDHRLTLGHQPNNTRQMGEQGVWQLGLVPLTVDQGHVVGFREKPRQRLQALRRDQRGVQSIGSGRQHLT